jgi:hypothetical protein
MKIGDLFVRLGVQADTFTLKDFAKSLGEIPFSVAAAVTSLTGMGFGLIELTKNAIDLGANLSMFRAETGLSTDELQRWTGVAKQMGMVGTEVQTSVMGIQHALAQLSLGQNDEGFMRAMGILKVHRGSPFDMMRQALTNANAMPNRGQAMEMLALMHIDPAMMKVAGLSPDKFNRMAKNNVVMTEGDIRAMADFQAALARFTMVVEKSFVPALTEVEPYMKDLAEALADMVVFAGKTVGKGLQFAHYISQKQDLMDAWITAGRPGHLSEWMSSHTVVNNHITTHVQSTADADEVASVVIDGVTKHVTRGMTHAMKQFNNGGQ